MITKKTCTKCNQTKPVSEFHKRGNSYKSRCKKCRNLDKKQYRQNNKEKIKLSNKKYHQNNKEKEQIRHKIYYENNKKQLIKQSVIYNNNRYKNDSNFRLIQNLRNRTRKVLNGIFKSKPTLELIGCSIEYLKEHLQQTAINNGYTDFDINNYSGDEYHIDHIKPCSSFDLSNPEEQKLCFHYSNLQILLAQENLTKYNKLL